MAQPPSRDTDANLPSDIRERVAQDFGPEQADGVYRHLLHQIPDGLANGTRRRHLRCILHLAHGDRALLDQYIELCLGDARDVMLAAEYEEGSQGGLVRKRDFEKPFAQSWQVDPEDEES